MKKFLLLGTTVLLILNFSNTFAGTAQDFYSPNAPVLSAQLLRLGEGSCTANLAMEGSNEFIVGCYAGLGNLSGEVKASFGKDKDHQCTLDFWASSLPQQPKLVSAACNGGYSYTGMKAISPDPIDRWGEVEIDIAHNSLL